MTDYTIPAHTPNWDVPLNNNLSDINNRITTTESNDASLQSQVTANGNAITTNTNNIASNTANITTLQGQMTSVTTTANGALQKSANLSDVQDPTASRSNLGLGNSATRNVGATTGTVAAGDDSRITGALQTTGGTMSGAIAMGTNKITGIGNGSAAQDAAAFGQIPTAGTGAANFTAGNDARLLQAYQTGAPMQGFISWNYDSESAVSSNSLTAGVIFMHKIWLPATTITNIGLTVITAGVGLTSGQNFAGIYNTSGTRQAVTTDQTTNWNSTGFKTCALSSPFVNATAGYYYVAFVCNAATTVAAGASSNGTQTTFNANVSTNSLRHGSTLTGQTSLPSSITMSGLASTGASHWVPVW